MTNAKMVKTGETKSNKKVGKSSFWAKHQLLGCNFSFWGEISVLVVEYQCWATGGSWILGQETLHLKKVQFWVKNSILT